MTISFTPRKSNSPLRQPSTELSRAGLRGLDSHSTPDNRPRTNTHQAFEAFLVENEPKKCCAVLSATTCWSSSHHPLAGGESRFLGMFHMVQLAVSSSCEASSQAMSVGAHCPSCFPSRFLGELLGIGPRQSQKRSGRGSPAPKQAQDKRQLRGEFPRWVAPSRGEFPRWLTILLGGPCHPGALKGIHHSHSKV